jgi:hypothetical protein
MRIALPKFSRSVSKSNRCIVILRIMYFNMMVHTGFEPIKRCPKLNMMFCHESCYFAVCIRLFSQYVVRHSLHPILRILRRSVDKRGPNPCSFGLHRLPLTLQISFQNTIIETHSATVGQTTASKIRCRAVTIWAYYFALSAFQL